MIMGRAGGGGGGGGEHAGSWGVVVIPGPRRFDYWVCV